ncbi:hypothetical protein V7x_33750 [Crateriforma conspicua]|uniref:Glyoxalase/fosfomycin resistance/dioxygenase domain-containing protein n=1 Tax=Crateriforma conspicua TaxID=2527996 RepID=A0A5C6FI35_9PLAN|nr:MULTISPECIES: VOC family protein [Crateriforma]TWU61687.1 hypothetical protein V7x_33750 [Crateriforma conspicua]
MTPNVSTYLFFDGHCEEALRFYESRLDAEILFVMRFKDNPEPNPDCPIPAGFDDKIMHASVRIGNTVVMASDGASMAEDASVGMNGFRMVYTTDDPERIRQVFDHLADGGKPEMPPVKTFWSPSYGMVTDRFGVPWMVMCVDPEQKHAQVD